MRILIDPDDVTAAAIRRLAKDNSDGQRLLGFLEQALADRDARNRPLADGVQLRMGQGAALALAQVIGIAKHQASAGVLTDTASLPRPVNRRTPRQ